MGADAKVGCRGAIMTPKEMLELTESWRPYRSIGKLNTTRYARH